MSASDAPSPEIPPPVLKLRWLIVEKETRNWDDRDGWKTSVYDSPPKLQFWDGANWHDVPTVRERA